MAGTLTTSAKNALLTSLNLKTIKLHSADPTEAGTQAEVAGAVKDFTVSAAAAGAIQSADAIEIDITVAPSATVTVAFYSLWDNTPTTPKCVATGALSASQSYTATGKYIVNSLTVDLNK